MLDLEPQSDGTDIGGALRYLTNAIKKRCNAFVLSDMIDADKDGNPRWEDALKVAAGRHELSVIKVHDPRELSLPDVGLVHIKDSETGRGAWVNTSSRKVREKFAAAVSASDTAALKLMRRYHIDNVEIATGSDYVRGLMAFFGKR